MTAETLAGIAAAFSGVSLMTLLAVAFHAGRWMGRTDVQLEQLDGRLEQLETRIGRWTGGREGAVHG